MNEIKTRRNMSTLINAKLPREVFSIIFHHTKRLYRLQPKEGYSYSWIPCVSHVCHHWRSIALSQPSLWTDGIPKDVDAFQTFLNRSRDLPIALDEGVTSLWYSQPDLVPLVLLQMGRVRELCIDVPGTNMATSTVLEALNANMPLLEVFHMRVSLTQPLSRIPDPAIPMETCGVCEI